MELTYKRQNVYALADEKELNAISDYAQGYKKFLDNGKTEREVVAESVEIVEKAGYKPYVLGDKALLQQSRQRFVHFESRHGRPCKERRSHSRCAR